MSFSGILGQATAVATLERALRAGRVHHAYRFEGPDGVGKETTALRLAQALVCDGGEVFGCEVCGACRRAVTFAEDPPHVPQHPDVLVLERGLYPSSAIGGASEATGMSVEQVRHVLLPRLGFSPHGGRAIVVLIRAADELTPSAANALLKTLEEPPPRTHFVLLTSRPGRLLDTIRSRTLALRFGPLAAAAMQELLAREELPPDLISLAGGSLARARALAEPESRARRDAFVSAADRALSASHSSVSLDFADERPEGRDLLLQMLTHLSEVYAGRARHGDSSALWAERHAQVQRASREVERNGSPALVLEALMLRMRADS